MESLGKILNIEEVENVKLDICKWAEFDGYKIITDKHEFNILIENGQCCCESWGYFYLNDNIVDFIGSELLEVNLTDTALNKQKVEKSGYYEDEGGIQFVDFVTNKGVLQFAVYNAHNGYYGHSIIFTKDKETFNRCVL